MEVHTDYLDVNEEAVVSLADAVLTGISNSQMLL